MVAGTFTLTAATLSIELARYGFGDRSGLSAPVLFWGVLALGLLVTTVVFAPIGVWVRIACAIGGFAGGAAGGVVFWLNEGGTGLWYFVLIASVVSGWVIAIYLAWMLLVGAFLKASGARGFPGSARKVGALSALTGALAIGGVVFAGERGAFVCPPWPLERSQVPEGYCEELVDRGLVGTGDAFIAR